MRDKYELHETIYICGRCKTPIKIPSDSFYEFGDAANDTNFWCEQCDDMPWAENCGTPAIELPASLKLMKGFELYEVPRIQNGIALELNHRYKPYSKRSFLYQYKNHLTRQGHVQKCDSQTNVEFLQEFNRDIQAFTESQEYGIADRCNNKDCQFLMQKALKPEDIECDIINLLCDVNGRYGLCQTGDEAMILRYYLSFTGGDHFPMLIPQPSILFGKKRPDFITYVPITKFQYSRRVVLIDRPNKTPSQIKEENTIYENEGYSVYRILIDGKTSYFKMARDLALWVSRG